MAITYNATSNRIFLDPDGVDTNYTLDDIVTAQPTYASNNGSTYTFTASIIVVGTSASRAILTATNSTLHFTDGILGNMGGRLELGELATVDEIPRNGCTIIYEGNGSTHGRDPYYKSTDRDDVTKEFPLAHTSGQVFIYNTQYQVINNTSRNDMLDIRNNATEVDIRGCIFDGNTDGGAPTSYTHIFCANTYLEDVSIVNFGVLEIGASTIKEWVGVSHLIGDVGLSGFQASESLPVKLFGLDLKQQTTFGKRPTDSYCQLTNLKYDGAYTFEPYLGTYNGIWDLLYTVDVKAVADGVALENCRTAMTDTNDTIVFDALTDVDGVIPQQRAKAYTSEVGESTFNVDNNPFYFRAWSYGKRPLEIPSGVNDPLVMSATMIDSDFITLSKATADAIPIDFQKPEAVQTLADSSFEGAQMTQSTTGVDLDTWYSTELNYAYIDAATDRLYLRRNWSIPAWNDGAIVYQNFSLVNGTTYNISVKVDDMGDATQFRFGFASCCEYVITSAGTYNYEYVANGTETKIRINADPGAFNEHVKVDFFKIYDPTSAVKYTHDGQEYSYKCDCLTNSISDVYHKLASMWADVPASTDSNYPISIFTKEALGTVDGTNFDGTQGILFENFTGRLRSITSNDGTVFNFPTTVAFTLSGLQPNSEVRIFRADNLTELDGIENSGTTFSYNYQWSGDIDIFFVIHHENYGYIRTETTLTVNNTSIPIQQQFDRNYKNN